MEINLDGVKQFSNAIKRMDAFDAKIYHNAQLLLNIYTDVIWGVDVRYMDLKQRCDELYGNHLSFSTIATIAGFEFDKKADWLRNQLEDIEANSLMIEAIHETMTKLKTYPHQGEEYFQLLNKTYFVKYKYDEYDLYDALAISRTTYFRRKKKALCLFGSILWGYILPHIMEQFKQYYASLDPETALT
jgi:hypothetical protein